jgi:predicted amidohydrolase YtcJ
VCDFKRRTLVGFWICVLAITGCDGGESLATADTVLMNGRIYLGNVENPWASDIAIKGKRFVYVGDDATAHIGSTTKVYDLAGMTVLPGLIDGHTHPGMVAMSEGQVVLEDALTKAELMGAIRKMVAEHPDREVLIGGFWPNEFFGVEGPQKEELDAIEPNRPLILYDDWTHSIWANSAALTKASVSRDTKDIVPGFSEYKKGANGEPTGWITESAASVFLSNFLSVSPKVEESKLDYLNYFRSVGVTTVLDAGNFGLDREVYSVISRLDKEGKLPVRYHGVYTLFIPDDLPTAVQTLKKLGEDFNSDNVRIDTLKVFFDGVMETRTAALSMDYLDTPGNSGEALLSREQVHQLILELEAEGLNFHAHSVGDRATTTLLDAIQDAHDTLSRSPTIRITICHLEITKESDFARFKKLGVVANFTPHWAVGGDSSWLEKGIGGEVNNMQRAQPMISDGAVVTFSSDNTDASEWQYDRESSSPFVGIQVGHTRQDIDVGEGGDFIPPLSERLQIDDLVNGYTSNAAYQLGRSSEIGTIAIDYRADLVVLNQNLFEVDDADIHKTKPIAVMVDGKLISGGLQPSNSY